MDKETLYRFFEGATSPEEESEIRKWLESSPAHRDILLRERKLFDTCLLVYDPRKRVRPASRRQRLRASIPMRTLLQTAATVAITFFVSIWLLGNDPLPEPGMLSLEVPIGQRIHVTLPDGTSVWLNSCSKMEYPGLFTEKSREITLDGEAYFEVTHQPGKPFVVHTVYGDIEVLGTTFNVEAYSQDDSFTTSLLEGSVQVTRDEETIVLEPDQAVRLSEGKLTISPITGLHTYRWKEGLICFDNESFGQILKKLEKYYNVQIHLQPGTDTSRRYSGKFRQEDGIEAALKILQKDLRFTYTREPGRPLIHIK